MQYKQFMNDVCNQIKKDYPDLEVSLEIEEKLKGFLNLCENCKKQNNYELNSFALGKKIVKKFLIFINR